MDDKRPKLRKLVFFALLLSGGLAYASVDPESVSSLLNDALSHQVTQFTIAFSIAAWLHSGRVKKEIKNQLGGIVASIDSVAQALRQDLQAQSERLRSVESKMTKLSTRVENLETKKTTKGA